MGNKVKRNIEDCDFLTAEMISEHLHLTRRTVYEFMTSGQLPTYKIGAARRVTKADYYAWLETFRDNRKEA
ncbi:helix-turn-helix domain-containing protein [Paenibacillus albus]|uniref:DNA-binding protein n=1 Tax=Paenibacillus albus TaxID=2495582 RepID=A0A3S9A406_9BACL|nr:helix-turn-helix domain-containing protein [Paenibacillus albus]AZN40451.1 DNA-binding protein [Paenibacillus albus]